MFKGVFDVVPSIIFLLMSTFSINILGSTTAYLFNYKMVDIFVLLFFMDFSISVVNGTFEWFL